MPLMSNVEFMSSIGLIFREERDLESLPDNWGPTLLGGRSHVLSLIERALAEAGPNLALELRIEEESESEDPRTVSVSGVWGEREREVIGALCKALDARFYDAESCEFIDL